EHAAQRFPARPGAAVPPPVPERAVRALYENIEAARAPGDRGGSRSQYSPERLPGTPLPTAPGAVLKIVVSTASENVEATRTPGGGSRSRRKRATQGLPGAQLLDQSGGEGRSPAGHLIVTRCGGTGAG